MLTNDSKKFVKVNESDESKNCSPHCYNLQTNDEIKIQKVSTVKRKTPVWKEDEDGYTATRQKAATTEWLADDKRRVRSPVINWLRALASSVPVH